MANRHMQMTRPGAQSLSAAMSHPTSRVHSGPCFRFLTFLMLGLASLIACTTAIAQESGDRMKRNRCFNLGAALLTAVLLLAGVGNAHAQTNCGDEGQTSCSIFNNDYYYNNGWQACQKDLDDQSGNCVNSKRHTHIGEADPWVAWAMGQQRQIGRSAQLNWITTMGTHNSYSSSNQGYTASLGQNQVYSITDQLEHGARILEIDAHAYLYNLNGSHLSVCHGTAVTSAGVTWVTDSQECAFTSPGKARYLSTVFQEIRTWLQRNPNEVLTLFIDLGGPDNNNLRPGVSVVNPQSSLAVGATGDFRSDFHNDLLNVFGESMIWSARETLANGGHFPSIDMMQQSHKQLLLIGNAKADPDDGLQLVHTLDYKNANGRWPTNSDDSVYENIAQNSSADALGDCYSASDQNTDLSKRPRDSWFRIGEGRTLSDSSDDLVYEPQVSGASLCPASYIEVDFLYSLDQPFTGKYRRRDPDQRYKASIWSWKEGESAAGQTAVLSLPDQGRWISGYYSDTNGQPNSYPAICMALTGENALTPYWGAQRWFATGPVPYSQAKNACRQNGGQFLAPYNARENSAAYNAARVWNQDHGINHNNYWINYEANAEAPHFPDTQTIFRYTTGGPGPQPATVTMVGKPDRLVTLNVLNLTAGFPGAVTIAPAQQTSFRTTPVTIQLDASGRASFQIALQSGSVSALGNVLAASVTASYLGDPAVQVLPVYSDLISTTEVTSWLTGGSGSVSEETLVTVNVQPNSTPGFDYHGTIQVFDSQTLEGVGPSLAPVKTLNLDGSFGIAKQRVDSDFAVATFRTILPAGQHQLVAKYEPDAAVATSSKTLQIGCIIPNPHGGLPHLGQCPVFLLAPPDSEHTPGSGQILTATTTPHLAFKPSSLSLSMRAGDPVPSPVKVSLDTCNANVTTDQPWLTASLGFCASKDPHPFLTANFSGASTLVPGAYDANIIINDKQHNRTGVTDELPVKLLVTTTISASPASLVLSPEHPDGAVTILSNPPGTVKLTAVPSASGNALVNLQVDQTVYPPVIRVSLNPLFHGVQSGSSISVTADVAPSLKIPVQITR